MTWFGEGAGGSGSGGADVKSGVLIPGNFSGNPKRAVVAFATAYPDDSYGITFGTETANNKQFVPVAEGKTAAGFTVNLSANNIANLVEVSWHAIPVGE